MKSAHLILHVRKSGVYSAAAGGPEVLCRIISGILGAPRTGARDGAAPVGTAPSGPGAGATWWRVPALQRNWENRPLRSPAVIN